ncbi:hypothetical protein [Fructilactobacillus florum]|nr:hypothetical protein [Fructilactobacillus florum]
MVKIANALNVSLDVFK